MKPFSAAVGDLIKKHRVRAKITQDQLAHRVKLTRTSISNMESGRQRIQLDTLYIIAEVLKVEISDLLPLPEAIARNGLRCDICGLDLFELYGALAKNYTRANLIKKRLKKFVDQIDLETGRIYCANCREILELNPELKIEEMQ